MLTTLAFLSALSVAPAQSGPLQLTNQRATYGMLGALRPSNKILPGDVYHLAFDIENLEANLKGEVEYAMGMEVINPQGQTEYKKEPDTKQPTILLNVFGGNRIPAFAYASTDPNSQAPGKYKLRVTVVDVRKKNTQQRIESEFEVLPKEFGIVDVVTTYNPQIPAVAPMIGVAGQVLYINFWTVGFEVKNKMVDQSFQLRILDQNKQATTKTPTTLDVNQAVPANVAKLPMSFQLSLNRVGNFTVEITATDKISNKTKVLTFPIEVMEQKQK